MAVTIGSVSAALVGFTATEKTGMCRKSTMPMHFHIHSITCINLLVGPNHLLMIPSDTASLLHAAVQGPISEGTTHLITILLLPVALLMIAYALSTFYLRSVYLQKKQVRPPCLYVTAGVAHKRIRSDVNIIDWNTCAVLSVCDHNPSLREHHR